MDSIGLYRKFKSMKLKRNSIRKHQPIFVTPRDRCGRLSRKLIHPPWLVPEYVWIAHKFRSRFLNEIEVGSVLIPVDGGYCSDIGVDFVFVILFVVRRSRNGHGKIQRGFDGGAFVCSFFPGV